MRRTMTQMPLICSTSSRSLVRLESNWAFIMCWLAVTGLLYFSGNPLSGPSVFPDEVCRLGWARLLSGAGPHFDMNPASYCQPYYPLLLAPFQWLTQDPALTQKAVFGVNSALAAACLPLSIRLGLRHFQLSPISAWTAALCVLAYPSLTLYSHHALPETMLFLGVLLAFVFWCNWIDRPDWRRFASLLAISFLLFAMHRKMLIVPTTLMVGAILGHLVIRTPEYRLRMLLATLILSLAFLIDFWIKNVYAVASFRGGDGGAVEVVARLSSWHRLPRHAGVGAGILVYATLVTGGLIWLVIGSGLDSIRRSIQHGFSSIDTFTKKSWFAFGMVSLLLLMTAIYFGGGLRFDIWFYGRHIDAALAAALIPAIAMIAKQRVDNNILIWAVAFTLLAFMVLAATIAGPPWEDFSRIHVVGSGPIMERMYQADTRWNLLAYCAGLLAIVGAIYLARLPGLYRITAVIPFIMVTTTTHLTTEPFQGVPVELAVPSEAADMLRRANPCHLHYDSRGGGRLRLHQYFRLQYHFPHCTIELVSYLEPPSPGSFVVMVRTFADCAHETECHELHPDLVLYRAAAE